MRYEVSYQSANEEAREWWDIIDTETGDILLGSEQGTEEAAIKLAAELNGQNPPRAEAEKLLAEIRRRRFLAESAYRGWERNMSLSNAIRRDDARNALSEIEYAEPVALWVLSQTPAVVA